MKKNKIAAVALIATVGFVSTFASTTKPTLPTVTYDFNEVAATTTELNALVPAEISDISLWSSSGSAGDVGVTKL